MCGIAGFFNPCKNYLDEEDRHRLSLKAMAKAQSRRGPDDSGLFLNEHVGLAHARLAIIDLSTGHQPMFRTICKKTYGIVYNGELYNLPEMKRELIRKGWGFLTASDTEVVLAGFIEYGPQVAQRLNGIFAFAVMDPIRESLFLFRDRAGVKPLFYAQKEGDTIFSSEIKGLLSFPGIRPILDFNGLNQIFSIGPARTSGCGVLKGIQEVLPGHYLACTPSGNSLHAYWKLESQVHEDSYGETVEKTAWLIQDAIRRQMVSDVPICTFLSGGVDSSLVSAVCSKELEKQGKKLDTFSFDFVNNDKYFKANSFQPSQDRPFVDLMAKYLGSNHHYLECDSLSQADRLYDSVLAHDLPAMADIDSSLVHFCALVSQYDKVALTGECADEIFGGYPWFHKEECLKSATFPWTMDLEARKALLSDETIAYLHMEDYVQEAYEKSVAQTPRLAEDSPLEARRREISYLNLVWFMQTLLNRMDRASMYSGLEARVPFADHRIIEYAWNVPWEMKARGGMVKGLLRDAGKGLVPDEILYRRKSPYPKTYDKNYEKLLARRLGQIARDPKAPVMQFLDRNKVDQFIQRPWDYGKPWYGQLMAGPQMMAYMIQVNHWMEHYQVQVEC